MALSIDYGRTAPLELIVEDRLLDRVWAYLTSDAVLEDTLARIQHGGAPAPEWATPQDLRRSTRLEARLSRWTFIGSHQDPEAAALLANAWAESAQGALSEALDHAWRAVELQDGVLFPNCIQVLHGPSQDELWECFIRGSNIDPSRVAELRAEIAAAHGVSPMISHDPVERAMPPAAPTSYDRGSLVLAGALVGVIAAVGGLLFVPAPRRG